VEIIAIRLREPFRRFLDGDEADGQDPGTKPRPKEQVGESRHTLACAAYGVKLARTTPVPEDDWRSS